MREDFGLAHRLQEEECMYHPFLSLLSSVVLLLSLSLSFPLLSSTLAISISLRVLSLCQDHLVWNVHI